MAVVEANRDIIRLLHRSRIFFKLRDATRPGITLGTKIDFNPHSAVEPYIGLFQGTTIPHRMGAFSSSNSRLPATIRIGRYCSIGPGLKIFGGSHPMERVSTSPFTYEDAYSMSVFKSALADRSSRFAEPVPRPPHVGPPVIGHDVWIGQDVTLARGITIGDGAVVAACSVVTKSVPPYHVVAGLPAKVLRLRFPEETIDRLQRLAWWQYSFVDFEAKPLADPEIFCDWLEDRLAADEIKPYTPPQLTGQRLLAFAEAT